MKTFLTLSLAMLFLTTVVTADPAKALTYADVNTQAIELFQQGKYAEAVEREGQAIKMAEEKLSADDEKLTNMLLNLARMHEAQKSYADAVPIYQRIISIQEKNIGAESLEVAGTWESLGSLYVLLEKYTDAEQALRKAIAVLEKAKGADNSETIDTCETLAWAYQRQNKYADALALHERVLAAREKSLGPEDPKLGNVCHNIAYLDEKLRKYKEAEAMYKRALAIRERAKPDGADVAQSLDFLAKFYYNQGKFMSAEPYLKRDLAVKEKLVGANNPELIAILELYADVLEQMKKVNAERQVKDRLRKLREIEKESGKPKSE
jgi:tetratricopeptide (TPR) repeat protein